MSTTEPKVAMLDASGVYFGMFEPADIKPPFAALPQITDCDLPIGEYRWDDQAGAFVPLPKFRIRHAPNVPSLEAALMAVITYLAEGESLPKAALDWASWYAKTVEGGKNGAR